VSEEQTEAQTLSCNFCGKARNTVKKLIAGPSVYICDECVTISYNIIAQEKEVSVSEPRSHELMTPKMIYDALCEYVVGHSEVKQMLSVSAYNHFKRLSIQEHDPDIVLDKSNILICGPTGSGKTHIAKSLAKILDTPFTIADATTITEAGYVGEDVESVLERLLVAADYDLDRAEQGIIYIDEIDKKARSSESNTSTRDVSGEGVQQALLRLIEGTTCKVKINISNRKYQSEEYVEFDTSNVLFIVGGAFVGLEKIIERRVAQGSAIGFGAKIMSQQQYGDVLTQAMPKDFVDYGLIPEFMGRVPVLGVLNRLTPAEFLSILTEVKGSIISQYKMMFEVDKIELDFTESFFLGLLRQSDYQGMGARSLRSTLESALMSSMYRAPELSKKGVTQVTFTEFGEPPMLKQKGKDVVDKNYTYYRGQHE
jgi:ATP-dependent Clp protease ATP-binding subunit ClpX